MIVARTAHTLLFATLGMPATLLLTGELLITLNEQLLGEQASFRLQSDFVSIPAGTRLELPGPHAPRLDRPARAGELYPYLVEAYAPVIVQKVAHHPEWDIPLDLAFDGNMDPRDNIANEPLHRPHHASVYGEMTAETEDSYYLTYSLYHVKDYDHPVREMITRWSYHDNDNEGLHLRVDKRSLAVVEVETWFHNRFLLYNTTGVSHGTEPVHGRIHLEDGTRVIVYAQSQGHGVRLAQVVDNSGLLRNAKILRPRLGRGLVTVDVDRRLQVDATYDLVGFDEWYAQARGPFGHDGQGTALFEERILLGQDEHGKPLEIGYFLAGRDYAVGTWSRPKPMWSWDDGWDEIPVLVWHFLPAASFASHGGSNLSHRYLFNGPCQKVFGTTAERLAAQLKLPLLRRRGPKWQGFEELHSPGQRSHYWAAASMLAKRYVNYIFHALG